ncbi:hypothetical protein ACVXHB_11500 [Escherichia coli]
MLSCIHFSHGFGEVSSVGPDADHCLTSPHHRAIPCAPAYAVLSGKAGEAYQTFRRGVEAWSFGQVSVGSPSSAR